MSSPTHDEETEELNKMETDEHENDNHKQQQQEDNTDSTQDENMGKHDDDEEEDYVEEDNIDKDETYEEEDEGSDDEVEKQLKEDERIAQELQDEEEAEASPPARSTRRRTRSQKAVNYADDDSEDVQNNDGSEEDAPAVRSKYSRGTRASTRRTRTITRRSSSRSTRSRRNKNDDVEEFAFPQKELRSRSNRVNYAELDGDEDFLEDEEEEPEPQQQQDEEEDEEEEEEEEESPPPKRTTRRTARTARTQKKRKGRAAAKRKKPVASEEDDDEDSDVQMGEKNNRSGEDSDSEQRAEEEEEEEELPIIEYVGEMEDFAVDKILGMKFVDEEDKIKYLIKFKDRSYIHTEWVTKEEANSYKSGASKIKNFEKKYSLEEFEGEEEFFNPSFCEVDRILDVGMYNGRKMYFVKWKMLGYDECTWEYEDDVHDHTKIHEFMKRRVVPSRMERRIPPRPPSNFFQKLEVSPKFKDGNELREYQLEGLNWLVFCWFNKRNSILADEMGLGKTVQTVSMIEWLRTAQHNRGPFIIIAPLSTIGHWKREFENWTEMNAIVFHGNQSSRELAYNFEFYYYDQKGKVIPNLYKFHVLITTYETVLAEASKLNKIKWQYMAIDEGHRLKNKKSKLLEVLKNFKAEHKLLLTGTPLQNDMEELWSLLNFIDAKSFPSSEQFLSEFGNMQSTEDLAKLHKLIGPYLLRRLKEDVEKSIPPKEEIVVEVVPTNIQKQYYRAILDRNREFLKRGVEKAQNVPKLVNILMEIRKVCNHPFLIDGAEENITKHLKDETELNESLIKASSKLLLVDKLLKKLREGGHKVLIFSQMVRVLNILEDFLQYRNYPYVRLDGTIRGDERQQAVDRFNNPQIDTFVFLVSTRAGGVGINLTSADTVIIFDSDWNPQNDLQAQARCHRIGQTKDVKIYRLLTKNTREKEMFEKASRKLGLDRAVLNGNKEMEFESFSKKDNNKNATGLDKDELDTLLKYGAYAAFKDDTEDEKMLVEGDIDSILERNSTVVRYDTQNENEENKQTEKGVLSFSKATFCFNESGEDVDINDADFWTKMLPEQKNAEGLMRKLSEKGSLKAEEEIEQFFVDLNVLIEENSREMKHFNYDGCDALANLLTQVIYSVKFDKDRIALAKHWLDLVDKPRLRNQKHGAQESDEEEEEDADEYQDATTESKKGLQSLGGWYKAERQRFQKAFLEFGWGKWDQIRAAKLTAHTTYDIISFAENFIHVMRRKLPEDEKTSKQFLKQLLLSNAVPEEDHEEHDHGDEESSTTTTNGTIKSEAPADHMDTTSDEGVNHVKVESSEDSEEHENGHQSQVLKIKPDPSTYSKIDPGTKLTVILPTPKEGQLEDAHLEIILQRKEKAKDRPNMCIRWVPLSEEDLIKGGTEITAPGFPGKFILRVTGSNASATSAALEVADEIHPCLAEKEYLETIQRTAKTWVKKLHFAQNLHRVVGIDGEKTFKIPKLGLKAPAPWWNDECDGHLLIGIVKHGYGRIDAIKNDESLCITSTYNKAIEATKNRREKKTLRDSMPNVAAINKRAMKLVETMMRDLDKATTGTSASTSSDSSSKLIDVHDTWSKREKQDLQRCLMNRGLYPDEKTGDPQWTKIALQANLKKTNQQIEDMVNSMVERAHEIKAEADGSDDDEQDKKKTKDSDKSSIELTPITAQKLLSRINIMNELAATVFPHLEDFSSKLKYLTTTGHGLPKWWKSSDDMTLVRGVRKYGFDFKKIFEKYPDDKKAPREGLLIKRLSQIGRLGGKMAMLGSPTSNKNAGQWVFTPKKGHVNLSPSPMDQKKKKARVVSRSGQTSIRKFTIGGDEDDPIVDSDDDKPKKGPRVVTKKKAAAKPAAPRVHKPASKKTKASTSKKTTKASTSKATSSKSSSSKTSTSKTASSSKASSKSSSSTPVKSTLKLSSKASTKSSPPDTTSPRSITYASGTAAGGSAPPRRKFKRARSTVDEEDETQQKLSDLPPIKKLKAAEDKKVEQRKE